MFVERPTGPLFYQDSGAPAKSEENPETIIFLHGVAVNHEMWRHWVPVLGDRFRLLTLDLRGFGQSNGMTNIASWTIDDVSDDVLAVADQEGVAEFHVIGESFGGTAVLNLATRGLDRVLTTTCLSTAHRGGQIERVRAWQAEIENKGIEWWSAQMMDHRFTDGALNKEEYDWFKSMQDLTLPEPLLRAGNILLESDLTSKLGNINCPLLLISADRSPFVTPDIPVEILNAVPSAQLCIIPGAKHGIPFSHGSYCAGQFLEFLGRCRT